MDLIEAMQKRHSVRRYTDKPIEGETLAALQNEIARLNEQSRLNMQLVLNEEKAFGGAMAHYGNFLNVKNYVAIVGEKGAELSEKAGYYGEKLVLFAQTLGLNTCWVALTYKKVKNAYSVKKGEKLLLVISIGYGKNRGVQHKGKTADKVSKVAKTDLPAPDWFNAGINAALLAPTAVNQQKFCFILKNGKVTAKAGIGFYTKVDLGIAKYHFELGANKKLFDI